MNSMVKNHVIFIFKCEVLLWFCRKHHNIVYSMTKYPVTPAWQENCVIPSQHICEVLEKRVVWIYSVYLISQFYLPFKLYCIMGKEKFA